MSSNISKLHLHKFKAVALKSLIGLFLLRMQYYTQYISGI